MTPVFIRGTNHPSLLAAARANDANGQAVNHSEVNGWLDEVGLRTTTRRATEDQA